MKKTAINKFLLLAFALLAIMMFGFVSSTTSVRADSTSVDSVARETDKPDENSKTMRPLSASGKCSSAQADHTVTSKAQMILCIVFILIISII